MGQTISLSHIAPFVDVSRQKLYRRFRQEFDESGLSYTEKQLHDIVEKELMKEVESGCQTIQYQLITLQTTNGQAPFVTVFMYLNEVPEGRTRDDLATIIEVMLKQRMKGIKNEHGTYLPPAFPKLIYVLQENNITEGSEYWYLTELAARCSTRALVPDYISEKKMLELKGDCYPCMGCVQKDEIVTYRHHGKIYTESIGRMWERMNEYYPAQVQPNGKDMFIDTPNVDIYDQKKGFVTNYRIIRNHTDIWHRITFTNGRVLTCTPDHPFGTENRGIVLAKDLTEKDVILADKSFTSETPEYQMKNNRAWFYGFSLCDTTYYDNLIASVANTGEDDIINTFIDTLRSEFNLETKITPRKRGKKGVYKDLNAIADDDGRLIRLKNHMIKIFEGKAKKDRHIPNEVFSWSKEAKLHFLAGMIDADGYLNDTATITHVQIGSTNKELALQQMLLAQSLDMSASVYLNRYRENAKDNIRYRVEFTPSDELLECIVCHKKQNHAGNNVRTNHSVSCTNELHMKSVETIHCDDYSYDVTTQSEHFTVSGIYSHNCRSFLTPDRFTDKGLRNIANAKNWNPKKHKYYGRWNQGVVTISLPDVACSADGDETKFWKILNERLELCHRALRIRHERLLGTPSDVAPIQWQDGAVARLAPGETIDELLYHGYSTISLGYAGLAECVWRMKGCSHMSDEGMPFGLAVMQALNDACTKWKTEENIDYSVYGTPLETTTYKFAKCLQRRFGIIPHVSDKNYITNSMHCHVTEQIDAFEKINKEAEYQKLSPGGVVSYVELPDMTDNIPAVLEIMKHMYETILYAEINVKRDYCENCGYNHEMQIVQDGPRLVWECPNCGNRDENTLRVTRRTCGKQ